MKFSYPLRSWQEDAKAKWFEYIELGRMRGIIASPTGCGKTINGLSIVAETGRALWLAQRDVLIKQPQEDAVAAIDDVKIGVVKAERNELDARDIVLASVQTVSKPARLKALLESHKEQPFKIIVVDEAHHSASETHLRILDAFETVPTLGLTATPERHDNKGLAAIWGTKPIYQLSIDTAIDEGWLVPFISKRIVCQGLKLEGLRVNPETGDYDLSELEKEMIRADVSRTVADYVAAELRDHPHRKGIVFTVSVDQAERTSAWLRELGIRAESISGQSEDSTIENTLSGLKSGCLQIICNCDLLSEGYNDRSINMIVMAKPTRSKLAYIQRAGRGLRVDPNSNKEDLLILDLVGVHEAHGVVTAENMLEDKTPRKRRGSKDHIERELGAERDGEFRLVKSFTDATTGGVSGVTKRGAARSKWLVIQDGKVLALPAGEHGALLMIREPGEENLWMGFRLPKEAWRFEEARRIMRRPARQDFATGVCEDRARKLGVFGLSNQAAKWRGSEPTDGQLDILRRISPDNIPDTRGEASDIITVHKLREVFNQPT